MSAPQAQTLSPGLMVVTTTLLRKNTMVLLAITMLNFAFNAEGTFRTSELHAQAFVNTCIHVQCMRTCTRDNIAITLQEAWCHPPQLFKQYLMAH